MHYLLMALVIIPILYLIWRVLYKFLVKANVLGQKESYETEIEAGEAVPSNIKKKDVEKARRKTDKFLEKE